MYIDDETFKTILMVCFPLMAALLGTCLLLLRAAIQREKAYQSLLEMRDKFHEAMEPLVRQEAIAENNEQSDHTFNVPSTEIHK